MIEVKNLTKSYQFKGKSFKVFENLNFKLYSGESTALIGKNGAGKSTLLRILGGIDQADTGKIITDATISWPVGLVGGFQGSLSGRENVTFVSKIYSEGSKKNISEKIKKVEEFAEIGEYFDRPFKTYSSGMQARVTFGLSMAFDFDYYLIDEVTSAGDSRFREKSRRKLEELHEKSDFIMVDHNLWGLQFHCNRALLMHNGKIYEYDNIDIAIETHKELLNTNITFDEQDKLIEESLKNKKDNIEELKIIESISNSKSPNNRYDLISDPKLINKFCNNIHIVSNNISQINLKDGESFPKLIIKDTYKKDPQKISKEIEKYKNSIINKRKLLKIISKDIKAITVKNSIKKYFDYIHFMKVHPDMHGYNREDSIFHYSRFGHGEYYREPNRYFNSNIFLDFYPWTKDLKINLLYLFIRWTEEFPKMCEYINTLREQDNKSLISK